MDYCYKAEKDYLIPINIGDILMDICSTWENIVKRQKLINMARHLLYILYHENIYLISLIEIKVINEQGRLHKEKAK
jgi:hypothetical protein